MARSRATQILAVVCAVLVGIGYFWYTHRNSPLEPSVILPPEGEITVQGTMICLPHKNTEGPQTLECAFGLHDDMGRNYALRDTDPTYKNISGVPMNVSVIVTGQFAPLTDPKYQSIGIIKVDKISIATTSTE